MNPEPAITKMKERDLHTERDRETERQKKKKKKKGMYNLPSENSVC